MRLAFAFESPLCYGGGVSMVVRTLMEGLPDFYRFLLISPDEAGCLQRDPLFGRVEEHIPWCGGKSPPHPEFYQTTRRVLSRLVAARPDLVHFHSGGVFSWGNRWPGASWPETLHKHHIPCVWTNHLVVHLLHGYCGDRKPFWFKLAMLPFSYLGKSQQLAATSAEICVSNHDANKIRRWYFPFSKKVHRIYHSRLAEHEIAFSVLPREKMILSVGHLAFRKGHHILVQAFARICRERPEWRLVLVGPESMDGCAAWIRDFCRKEGIESKVEMAGHRNNPNDWMKRCSVFVQPSLQEALGLALQEAMACGCACVGTKTGGIPELIEDERSGLLCEEDDVIQLERALVQFMEHKELRERCGKAAVERVRALKMEKGFMIQAHRELYAQYGTG